MYRELSNYEFANGTIQYHAEANIVSMQASALTLRNEVAAVPRNSRVVVATAGTTDIPVAEEAAVTLEMSGIEVDRVFDVGVAGLHRIIRALPRLCHPDVGSVIVCAGMLRWTLCLHTYSRICNCSRQEWKFLPNPASIHLSAQVWMVHFRASLGGLSVSQSLLCQRVSDMAHRLAACLPC
jgi:NAD(P)-dependent dehydrogenase (short-subunit alcohol dehydrogenase family)